MSVERLKADHFFGSPAWQSGLLAVKDDDVVR